MDGFFSRFLAKYRQASNRSRYSSKVLEALNKAGWTESRDDISIEQDYQRAMGDAWLSNAGPFVRSFGKLSIGNRLWVYSDQAAPELFARQRVEAVVGCPCCPLASSGYLGDGCTIWIDCKGRFYATDSEGMLFLGDSIHAVLDVLLAGVKPELPPSDIKEAVERAWRWERPKGAVNDN